DAELQWSGIACGALHVDGDLDLVLVITVLADDLVVGFGPGRVVDFDVLRLGLARDLDDRGGGGQIVVADRVGVDVPALIDHGGQGDRLLAGAVDLAGGDAEL